MTIKEASERTGVSVDNLRYYERIGLIPEVPRNSSGIRDYDDLTLCLIDFIVKLKQSGMKLDSIREYMQLAMQGEETRNIRKEILIETKHELEAKLTEFRECFDVINHKIENYEEKCDSYIAEIMRKWKETREQE